MQGSSFPWIRFGTAYLETNDLSEKARELKKEVCGGYKDYVVGPEKSIGRKQLFLPRCSESLKLDLSPNITAYEIIFHEIILHITYHQALSSGKRLACELWLLHLSSGNFTLQWFCIAAGSTETMSKKLQQIQPSLELLFYLLFTS